MQIDEKIITAMTESNRHITESTIKAIDGAEKYNKRIFILFLSMLASFTMIIGLFIFCYFDASYGENYQQHITQTQEISTGDNIGMEGN